MIHFTSDTHFGHRGIIAMCDRPFPDTASMEAALVSNWNAAVTPDDTVFHLGDFAVGDPSMAYRVFGRLNGRKHLIFGNHDRDATARLPWDSVQHYRRQVIDGVLVVMFHYPILEWDGYFRNGPDEVASVNVFGHVHSTPTRPKHAFDPFQHDVGVDRNGFRPVSFPEILRIIRSGESI